MLECFILGGSLMISVLDGDRVMSVTGMHRRIESSHLTVYDGDRLFSYSDVDEELPYWHMNGRETMQWCYDQAMKNYLEEE